jgi:hypothetical protein
VETAATPSVRLKIEGAIQETEEDIHKEEQDDDDNNEEYSEDEDQ